MEKLKKYLKKPTSLRKKMILVFVFLIITSGLVISIFSASVYRYGYGKISRVYLSDVTKQTTNNLERQITDIEDIIVNLQISSKN